MSSYIKGKGVYVGTFSESDIEHGRDKKAVEEKKQETGLEYTNTEFVRKRGQIVGLKIYVCTAADFKVQIPTHFK